MTKDGWSKKIKGSAYIYTHPLVEGRAIVQNSYGIRWNGWVYPDLETAKTSALAGTPGKNPVTIMAGKKIW